MRLSCEREAGVIPIFLCLFILLAACGFAARSLTGTATQQLITDAAALAPALDEGLKRIAKRALDSEMAACRAVREHTIRECVSGLHGPSVNEFVFMGQIAVLEKITMVQAEALDRLRWEADQGSR